MDEKGFDYMNVIPLVDVMVLLVIVLMTSTFIASGVIPVELPKAAHGREGQRSSSRSSTGSGKPAPSRQGEASCS